MDRLVELFLGESDATQVEVGIRTERSFGECLQVVDQAAARAFVVATHKELFGGDIGQRILFAHFQADVAAYGVHIVGISIDIVEVDID